MPDEEERVERDDKTSAPDNTRHRGRLRARDFIEIAVGSCVMGFPVAATEEIWNLSESMSFVRIGLILLGSLFFLGLFTYSMYYHGGFEGSQGGFVSRVLTSYVNTLIICALILMVLDKFPLMAQPAVAVKRIILVGFPASFSATVVDSLR